MSVCVLSPHIITSQVPVSAEWVVTPGFDPLSFWYFARLSAASHKCMHYCGMSHRWSGSPVYKSFNQTLNLAFCGSPVYSNYKQTLNHVTCMLKTFLKGTGFVWYCQRPVFLVYPNICIKSQTCENLDSTGHQNCKRIMKEKTPLFSCSTNLCALRCIIKDLSWSLLLSDWEITSFSKLHYFRGSRFSQCVILLTALHCSLPSKFVC